MVLTGKGRGQVCTVKSDGPDDTGYVTLEFEGGVPALVSLSDLESIGFKRLPDLPKPLG